MSEIWKKVKSTIIVDEGDEDDENEEVEKNNTYEEVSNKNIDIKNADMVLFDPRSFEESVGVADALKNNKVCIVNIHRLNDSSAQRLLDFLYGIIYAIGGSYQKVDDKVIVYAPKKTVVGGRIEDIF